MLNESNARESTPALNRQVSVAKSKSLSANEEVVLVTLNDDAAIAIDLPPLSECRGDGRFFTVRVVAASTTPLAATVADRGDSPTTISEVLTASGDFTVLWTDGLAWYVLANKLTTASGGVG